MSIRSLMLAICCAISFSLVPLHAAVVIVDFGTTNNGLVGVNEVTTLPTTAVNLVTTANTSSGISLVYAGGAANTSSGAGYNTAFTRSAATGTAWSLLTGGADIADVNGQGLAFAQSGSTSATFTLAGLNVGEAYSLFLLSGVGGSGGSSYLQFAGVQNDYLFQAFDSSNVASPVYTAATSTLRFNSYIASGVPGSVKLDFTATSSTLAITIGNSPVRQGIQGLALVSIPEPSTIWATAAAALLGVLALRRRT